MAVLKEYKCSGCGYEISATPTGHDMLMLADLFHFACKDCRQIVDVYVPHGEKLDEPVCPKCSSKNLVKQVWSPITGKCPKCNGSFEETGKIWMMD